MPLAHPDVDDADAFLGRACNVKDQTGRRWIDQRRRGLLVVLPARSDVLNERVPQKTIGGVHLFWKATSWKTAWKALP